MRSVTAIHRAVRASQSSAQSLLVVSCWLKPSRLLLMAAVFAACGVDDRGTLVEAAAAAQAELATCRSSEATLRGQRDELQARIAEAEDRIEELETTPSMRLARALAVLEDGHEVEGRRILTELVNLHPTSEEAVMASERLAVLEREAAERRAAEVAEAERRRRIAQEGFAALSQDRSPEIGGVRLRFEDVRLADRFVFDRYRDRWHYREPTRGHSMAIAGVRVTSPDSQNPRLPLLAICVADGGMATCTRRLDWRLRRWRDYGAYLGNYSDNNNDFRHNETVRFSVGGEFPDPPDGAEVYLVASREPCVERVEDRWGRPPVRYSAQECRIAVRLTAAELDEQFIVVDRLE